MESGAAVRAPSLPDAIVPLLILAVLIAGSLQLFGLHALDIRSRLGNEEDLDRLAIRELIASMRAITASAFAIDVFYASIKVRSPEQPRQDVWREKRTARHERSPTHSASSSVSTSPQP
jgi:hypothetical protein